MIKCKAFLLFLITLLSLLLVIDATAAQQAPDKNKTDHKLIDPLSEIVVDSGLDLDTSKSIKCTGAEVCTLRRAIVESRSLTPDQLPVLISFNIPADPAEGYDSMLGVWHLDILSSTDTAVFRRIKGQVIIDGSTQPGGRNAGPKIILVGPNNGNKDGLIVGDVAGDDEVVIRGLGFQNFKTHIYVNTDNNLFENNWFGLTSAGMDIYLRDDNPEDGSGSAGIALTAGADDNVLTNNTFAGFDGVAVAIRGENNFFTNNMVGTRGDGSVPKQTDPNLICTTVDWLGGGGVSVADAENIVQNNIFAGLRQELFVLSTQPDAIRIDGDHHVIKNNQIGIDSTETAVGVCGRGIYLAGANTPEFTQITDNTIVNPQLSAISINGLLTDANTLSKNVIKQSVGWPQIEGNPEPEDAIQFGPSVPDALYYFNPGKILTIEGTAVTGTHGTNSPCPNCLIELFLDDNDGINEALQLLEITTADANGNWTAVLPFELGADQGIRTTSTTAQFNTIPNMSAGTTTRLSALYFIAPAENFVWLPVIMKR